ncbi:hypothetical protein BLS_010128 [Venturia inaequalis]|nr:hypothetical protein BLS_010128 [Venturia inaequalis]KAE9970937.1 hypothetical protein EG327_010119 [Venturia inaequalis]
MSQPSTSIPISFLDLPREIRQKILKQTFNPELDVRLSPKSQPLYPEENMNCRWNSIRVPGHTEKQAAEMRCVEDWMREKTRIGKWHENLVSVDVLVEEDMHWVANEWYEELSDLFGMLSFENLGKNLSRRSSRS